MGVFICQDWPTDQAMVGIARELGFQEVTFLRKTDSILEFDMRIFTINYELPFAGQPTLGTAWVARKVFGIEGNHLTLKCKLGNIPIEFSDSSDSASVTMQQQQPVFSDTHKSREIMDITNLRETDFDINMPILGVANGAAFIVVPLSSEQALRNIKINFDSWVNFLKTKKLHASTSTCGQTTSLYFYTPTAGQKNMYHVRMFSDQHNKPDEDAATGSAAGCLLAYLLKYKKRQSLKATIKQGEELGRPSELYLDGTYDGEQFGLKVGGKVKYVAKGQWSTNV